MGRNGKNQWKNWGTHEWKNQYWTKGTAPPGEGTAATKNRNLRRRLQEAREKLARRENQVERPSRIEVPEGEVFVHEIRQSQAVRPGEDYEIFARWLNGSSS